VLEQAKLVEIVKKQEHNRPLTVCRITASGRARYVEYLETLEQVIRDAANGAKSGAGARLTGNLAPTRA